MIGPCTDLALRHTIELSKRSLKADSTGWVLRHCQAWTSPRTAREKALRALIQAFAEYADSYAEETGGERQLGEDGYFHEHARDMVRALLALLNFESGRFDCGTLDKLIRDLAVVSGVELDQ
jgi:hypothetical protein